MDPHEELVYEVDESGVVRGLYDDGLWVDGRDDGHVRVARASWLRWDVHTQSWYVELAADGTSLGAGFACRRAANVHEVAVLNRWLWSRDAAELARLDDCRT